MYWRSHQPGQRFRKLKLGNAMAYEFEGKTIEVTATGYLADQDDWTEELAEHIAGLEHITLTERHWDLINYLRDEFFNNNENSPNTRTIVKAMSEKWGEKVDQRTLYDLFPQDPSKQGARVAGLPESRRKGGY
jgi:tRNA 2-thiouridine synthesizing protein E